MVRRQGVPERLARRLDERGHGHVPPDALRAEEAGIDVDEYVAYYAAEDQSYRDEAGPPAAWDPDQFGQSNIYVPPGVMWHELRTQLGDEVFWEMTRAWPYAAGDAFVSTGREEYWAWLSEQAGGDLTPFLTEWLLGETEPATTF